MLKELKKYENLGTPTYFWELLNVLKSDELWTENDVRAFFFNKVIDERSIFDGCLPLLELSGIISVDENSGEIIVNYDYRNILHSEQLCKQRLMEGFLKELESDNEFHSIFKNSHFDYLEHKSIVIDISAFTLQYSNFRKLLIDFDFLVPHSSIPRKYIINSKWKKQFDSSVTPKVRKLLGIEELKRRIEQQELGGEEAEKFVLRFEKKRLKGKGGIQWVAPYDSEAGFDILSFQTKESKVCNCFIEVKSFVGRKPYFYWSRNEINKASKFPEKYFIYLVNREEMNKQGYKPLIISNPSENILNDEGWIKEVNKFFITKGD